MHGEERLAGAQQVVALSKGQDDWGYFYPSFDYPFTATYDSDHHIYNVAPQAGDQVIHGQLDNLGRQGHRLILQGATCTVQGARCRVQGARRKVRDA